MNALARNKVACGTTIPKIAGAGHELVWREVSPVLPGGDCECLAVRRGDRAGHGEQRTIIWAAEWPQIFSSECPFSSGESLALTKLVSERKMATIPFFADDLADLDVTHASVGRASAEERFRAFKAIPQSNIYDTRYGIGSVYS
ncbi:hypothetical protein ASE73_09460 [Sphingomonas sp. Leaf24]|nr:hypothetical protein ASE50_07510 [Sphingomonas sp. Leaf5]KQM88089.1 hypothetical protein ASE73_09460 [Sphingomonas sp. Leaf24]